MSKRTSGSFREYLKTRDIALPDAVRDISNGNNATVSAQRESSKSNINEPNQSTFNAHELNTSNSFNNDGDDASKADEEKKAKTTTDNSFVKNNSSAPKAEQLETTDDWYASASDMDDSDSAVSKPYGYNAVNPVLECVNQVIFLVLFPFLHFIFE